MIHLSFSIEVMTQSTPFFYNYSQTYDNDDVDQSLLDSVVIESMLCVNDGPVLMNDDVSVQVLIDAIDEVRDIGLSHCLLLQLMVHIIGQMPHLLQPTLKESQILLSGVVEFGLFLLFVDGNEVLLQH